MTFASHSSQKITFQSFAMFAKAGTLALLAAAAPTALACLGYEGGVPVPTENVAISAPIYVKAGEVFDGGWRKYDRNPSTCNDQSEGGMSYVSNLLLPKTMASNAKICVGESDTAFVVERGGTLRNVIIGKTAGEGVYCKGGGCNLEFLWFEDVCEDAISIVSQTLQRKRGLARSDSFLERGQGGRRHEHHRRWCLPRLGQGHPAQRLRPCQCM